MRRSAQGAAAVIACAAALGMGLGSPAAAQEGSGQQPPQNAAPQAAAKPIVVGAGALSGTVVGLDGKTPIPGAAVVLEDLKGQEVAKAVSGADGKFTLPAKPEGKYRISIGSARGSIEVDAAVKPMPLMIMLPAEVAKAIRPAQGAEEGTSGTVIGLAVAGGVLVIGAGVGIGVAIEHGNDNGPPHPPDQPPVSPSVQ